MRTIEFKIVFADPAQPGADDKFVEVKARDINSGIRKAVAEATRRWPYELHSIEFWMVKS